MNTAYPIPAKALEHHIAILGKTGSGKTTAAKAGAENILDAGGRVCVVDPTGAWWGMKSSVTGKSGAYPFVIFGGSHADFPLGASHGDAVAEIVGTSNTPAIIDTSQMRVGERSRFFTDFADALMRKNRGPLHLYVDEAHVFMPQGKVPDPQSGQMLAAGNNMVSGGRSRGLRITLITQRPAKLHKDSLTQVETLVAMKLIAPQDRAAVEAWIEDNADEKRAREIISTLATLKTGEAWVWSPECDVLERVKFPRIRTFDSSAAPTGEDSSGVVLARVDGDTIREKLTRIAAEVVANDPRALKARIAELEREIKTGLGAASTALIPRETYEADKQEAQAFGERAGLVRGRKEASIEYFGYRGIVEAAIESAAKAMVANLREVTRAAYDEATAKLLGRVVTIQGLTLKPAAADSHARRMRSPEPVRAAPAAVRRNGNVGSSSLPQGERATLGACIQYPDGLERSQLTVLTGYKRSSRDAYIQRLREKGYVTTVGDKVTATQAGVDALPDFEPLPRGQDLIDFWMRKLPEGERKVLQHLIEAGGEPVDRAAIDQATGYQRSSRDAYLQRLRAKQLVVDEGRGQVKASAELFA